MQHKPRRVLIVDDEPNICRNCVKILSKSDYKAEYALNGYDALMMMEEEAFDVVVTDLKMSRLGGMEVLRRIREAYPDTKVIIITGYASVSSSVEVMKMGASDYLPKPFTPHEFRSVVAQALAERETLLQNQALQNQALMEQEDALRLKPVSHQLIGNSPRINKVISMIRKVAATDSTVLLYGESGTGKELVARAIHANSPRKIFFAVDCGTLSDNLLESELFGHMKGAFTGAHKDKNGIFRQAHRGTVFLDEISNISMEVQGKLLRFLETRDFLPLGGESVRKVDIRLVFATNRELEKMVAEGTFREDFYYRIFVYPIHLPALRERKADILPIAYHFLNQFSLHMGKDISGFDDAAAGRLMEYDWPGNVRQLRNVIERAIILCEKDQICLREIHLPGEADDIGQLMRYVPSNNEELKQIKKEIKEKAIHKVEKSFVRKALDENDWNVTQAASETGMQRSNFQKLMKKYGIVRR